MKAYTTPELSLISAAFEDILTSSLSVEEVGDGGVWEWDDYKVK